MGNMNLSFGWKDTIQTLILSFILLLISGGCSSKEQRPLTYFSDEETSAQDELEVEEGNMDLAYSNTGREVSVPYKEKGGIKLIPVKVNGIAFEMVLDSGCSTALITVAEASYLYLKGRLSDEDFLGTAPSMVADGRIVENMVVNLKNVVIGDVIGCEDVQATVVSNAEAPLLLGNEVLDRLASYSINNETKTVDFVLK